MPILLLFLVIQAFIPLLILRALRRQRATRTRDWLLLVLPQASYLLFIVVELPWGHLPYFLRLLWPLAFAIEAVRAWKRMRRAGQPVNPAAEALDPAAEEAPPAAEPPKLWPRVLWAVVFTLGLGRPAVQALKAYEVPEPPLELAFPLRQGVYLVGHGGSHESLNYHNVDAAQRYALDISKLNGLGMRALGFLPKRLEPYAIYGDTLHSPCDATVRTVVDGLPDHTPPNGDRVNLAGNHVELEAGGVRIFLAHMRRGSVRVKKGDRVRQGDPLGEVGNSGNTSEPHLHIHAVRGGTSLRDGAGVPITFGGRFLVRNDLILGR